MRNYPVRDSDVDARAVLGRYCTHLPLPNEFIQVPSQQTTMRFMRFRSGEL